MTFKLDPDKRQRPQGRWSARRVTAVFAIATLLPLALLAEAAMTIGGNAVTTQAHAKVQAAAELESRAVAAQLDGLAGVANAVAVRPSIVSGLAALDSPAALPTLQQALDVIVRTMPGLASASIDSPAGTLISISPPSPTIVGQSFAYRDWYKGVVRTGTEYVSQAFQSAGPGHPLVVSIVTPIRSPAGATPPAPIVGYVNLAYPLGALQSYVSTFERVQSMSLTITDQAGVVLAAPMQPAGLVSVAGDPRVGAALDGRAGTTSTRGPSGRVLSAFVRIPELGWTVHADVVESVALSGVRHLRETVAAIAAALAGVLLVALLGIRRLWRGRAASEELLRSREADLSRAQALAHTGSWSLDLTSGEVRWSDELYRLLGLPPGLPVTERDFLDRVHPLDVDGVAEAQRRAVASGKPFSIDHKIIRPDGEVGWMHSRGEVVADATGVVTGLQGTSTDITERKAAEDTLARQAALIEMAHDAIFVCDESRRIVFWNRGAELTYGYPAEAAIGQTAHELLDTRGTEPIGAMQARLLSTETWEGELDQRRADGTRIIVEGRWATVRAEDGDVTGTMEVNRDITARREAEAEVTRRAAELATLNEELRRSNEDLEQFAYIASHDLSEPLRAISGPVSLLARRYEGQLDADADKYIAFVVDGCQRMQHMIDDLLVFSRVGRAEGPLQTVDCNLVMNGVVAALTPMINQCRARVEIGPLPTVRSDATQLTEVLQNLVSNALKFTAPDVQPCVEIDGRRRGNEWRFSVTDNGIGVDPRHRERIFGMFKRLHGREEYPGTGIGLALVKKIVEHRGGRVGVEDAPGHRGSCFWFTLPAESDAMAA